MKTSSTFAAGLDISVSDVSVQSWWRSRATQLTSPPCRRLIVRRISPALAQSKSFRATHHTITLEVRFVADDDDGDVLVIFDADDLLAKLGELVEAAPAGDGENKEEPLACFHVQFSGK